jgi:hypothetical protein
VAYIGGGQSGQNLSELDGTCLGLLLLHVGPNGDEVGGQAFMEYYTMYNVNSTANKAGMITEIADPVLHHDSHSEHTQFAVAHLGKQNIILGYNWLHNHSPEINWQTKEVKMSCCSLL